MMTLMISWIHRDLLGGRLQIRRQTQRRLRVGPFAARGRTNFLPWNGAKRVWVMVLGV